MVSDETKQLIAGYLTDNIGEAEKLLLNDWLKKSKENKDYFNRLAATWKLAHKENEIKKFDTEQSWRSTHNRITKLSESNSFIKFIGRHYVKVAATWLLFFGLGSFLTLQFTKTTENITVKITEISAPLGSKSLVSLPDGSTLWLNAGSKIRYAQDFGVRNREVQLTGEAYFKVASNKAKPFLVKTGDVTIRALGTKFNVKAYPEEKTITATLEEGKIDIQYLSKENRRKNIELKPKENVVLFKSGDYVERKTVEEQSLPAKIVLKPEKIELHTNVKTELYTSWSSDRWIIESEPLVTLVPMLERRFNMKIKFSDSDLKDYKFTGIIENETVEQIMTAIRFTAPIDYTIEKDTILLTINKHLQDKYTKITSRKN